MALQQRVREAGMAETDHAGPGRGQQLHLLGQQGGQVGEAGPAGRQVGQQPGHQLEILAALGLVLGDETAADIDGEEELDHELDGLGVAGGGQGGHHQELVGGRLADGAVTAQQHGVDDKGLPGFVLQKQRKEVKKTFSQCCGSGSKFMDYVDPDPYSEYGSGFTTGKYRNRTN